MPFLHSCRPSLILAALLAVSLAAPPLSRAADPLSFSLRRQTPVSPGSGRFHTTRRQEQWAPDKTAVIVCDVWDLHHSQNAVRRVAELAPRLNEVLKAARQLGIVVIHSPSDCMEAYADHPARKRRQAAPETNLPEDIRSWCSRIPAEEQAVYPIDQSDGGDDDDPEEHAKWVAKLKSLGRDPGLPWKKQTDLLTIDAQRDYITDQGDEVWNILTDQGVDNVILTGVHTNMCVLGRPFGLRQMVRNGKHAVLMRDLTDTMYNPRRWPYVSHFAGTDLVVDHIERYVCPTVTSDQLLRQAPGGRSNTAPFRFAADTRPHLAVLIAEDEYGTERTLPELLQSLRSDFRITLIFGSASQRNQLPGVEAIAQADVLLLSVRRRTPPPEQLQVIRSFVESGKPVLGIRTASHAFCLRNRRVDAGSGLADWPEFDAQVFGGNYTNHYGNELKSQVTLADGDHPITRPLGLLPESGVVQHGSLYKVSPLAAGAHPLLKGKIEGRPAEPVAWTFRRPQVGKGGKSFYMAIGHPLDLQNKFYRDVLRNALYWAAEIQPSPAPSPARPYWDHWAGGEALSQPPPAAAGAAETWYRCAVRLPEDWVGERGVVVRLPPDAKFDWSLWLNGREPDAVSRGLRGLHFDRQALDLDDANLLVLQGPGGRPLPPSPIRITSGVGREILLQGSWQMRHAAPGDDTSSWSNIPLPARYGASTDILFEPSQ